jgi:hypothetical protein
LKSQSKFLLVIRTLRVENWYYLLGISLLALIRCSESSWIKVSHVFIFSSAYLCWGYVFNNFFDQMEDSPNRNAFKSLSQPTAATLTVFLSAILIFLGFYWSILAATTLVMGINALYSAPFARLKENLVFALLANGIFFSFVYYSSVSLIKGSLNQNDFSFCVFVFLLFQPLQYVHHLEHREMAGQRSGLVLKSISAGFLALLVAVTAGPWFPSLNQILFGTIAYAAACLMAVFYTGAAKEIRVRIRWLSMGFGLYLIYQSLNGLRG